MAYSASDMILGWAWKENGDWDEIYKHVTNKDVFDFNLHPLADIKKEIYGGNYLTLIDKDYPEFIRNRAGLAPMCLFWMGDLNILSENNAILIIARKASVSNGINKYSRYALTQTIKKYAPSNDIILSVSKEYHGIAMRAFDKYKGPGRHIIEFIDTSLSDYVAQYPLNEHANLVVADKFQTDLTAKKSRGMRTSAITSSKKIVISECGKGTVPSIISLALTLDKEIEAVPYPVFDTFHINNEFINDGVKIFLLKEEN